MLLGEGEDEIDLLHLGYPQILNFVFIIRKHNYVTTSQTMRQKTKTKGRCIIYLRNIQHMTLWSEVVHCAAWVVQRTSLWQEVKLNHGQVPATSQTKKNHFDWIVGDKTAWEAKKILWKCILKSIKQTYVTTTLYLNHQRPELTINIPKPLHFIYIHPNHKINSQ